MVGLVATIETIQLLFETIHLYVYYPQAKANTTKP